MTKRILSVIMVLVVFFGGYSIIPKKYNLLPVNDAYCARNYGGLYYVNKTFVEAYDGSFSKDGIPTINLNGKLYKAGTYVSLTTGGYDLGAKKKVDLRSHVGKELSFVRR